jgi:hypothetical protein
MDERMTDIFKSADWAREAERAKAEAARPDGLISSDKGLEYAKALFAEAIEPPPPLMFDLSKLSADEAEAVRREFLRPGGLIFLGEDPGSPKWSKRDVEFLTGQPITDDARAAFLYGEWPVSGKSIVAHNEPTIAEMVTAGWPRHELLALTRLCRGERGALLLCAGERSPKAVAAEVFDRWRELPGIEIKYVTRKICAGDGQLSIFVHQPDDERAWEALAGLHFDFAAIDPAAEQSKMAAMLLSRVRSPT